VGVRRSSTKLWMTPGPSLRKRLILNLSCSRKCQASPSPPEFWYLLFLLPLALRQDCFFSLAFTSQCLSVKNYQEQLCKVNKLEDTQQGMVAISGKGENL
jgi:hypothetical protein